MSSDRHPSRGSDRAARNHFDDRLATYTARLSTPPDPFLYDDLKPAFLLTPEATYETFAEWRRVTGRPNRLRKNGRTDLSQGVFRGYVEPLIALAGSDAGTRNSAFLVRPGDNLIDFAAPFLVKSRELGKDGGTTLLRLGARRHWRFVAGVKGQDKPFRAKRDLLVFRGGPTNEWAPVGEGGLEVALGSAPDLIKKSQRFALYCRLARGLNEHPNVDLGFTPLEAMFNVNATFAAYFSEGSPVGFVDPLPIDAQLDAKFLLSLEGNDVASGLRWMLSSNSLVIAPPPTRESWFLEGRLEPGRHFIAVKPDLSDLEEVLEWCLAHPGRCEEIIAEAQAYVRDFTDEDVERRLLIEVLRTYARAVSIRLAPSELYGEPVADNLTLMS